ncbi:hypothetical protein G3601_004063 [Salmonella enterica]|nr:hypothetical protein [Salmonella enterica subsp. enterica serovar 4,[5],12:b:-]EDQ8094341.1 hypothetical protein [Salmonella enterica subsp. enterica serovar Java]EDR2258066.1 hypothetical protein [Salmonella enterica]EEE5613415.1 hypothetical protein [Salmonella enterica subsp. enterica serovar Typhimurium]EKN5803207.1 hypothetical protein [Salmonella enterica subsp. enterica]
MSRLTKAAIHSAMFRSLEGYVSSVEFESGIKLNDEEQQRVYRLVEEIITRAISKGGAA